MRPFSIAIPLLMLVTLAGCPVNLDTPRYPTSQPSSKDLVGTYRPTADTIGLIKKTGVYADREISLTLDADGAFRINNIPDWWRNGLGKPGGGFDSGSGTWETVKQQRWWALQLHFADAKEFSPPHSPGGYLAGANLIGQKAPYDISLTVGDPDAGREMRFRRAPSATAAGG